MPKRPPPLDKVAAERLEALGARLRAHRKAQRVNATTTAEAAGISRVTLHRIERGEPSVTMGAYAAAIAALGLDLALVDPRTQPSVQKKSPPRRIKLADYAQLRRIAWQRGDVDETQATVTAKEALSLYERNWRHVDRAAMTESERALVALLVDASGGGRLLV
jgi:transcriptional regulator with XRE-family HTH domain